MKISGFINDTYPNAVILRSKLNMTLLLYGRRVIKIYSKRSWGSFNKEIEFYKRYQCSHTLKLYRAYRRHGLAILEMQYLEGNNPGFVSDKQAAYLSCERFASIRHVLRHMQQKEPRGILVHGDLAPHNIYFSGNKTVIIDWEHSKIYKRPLFKMYDYATLWSWFYYNEEKFVEIFLTQELPELIRTKDYESFKYCYLRRYEVIKKLSHDHLKRGKLLRHTILGILRAETNSNRSTT